MLKPNLRALATRDRNLAVGFAAYYVFGVLTNYTKTSPRFSDDVRVVVASFSLLAKQFGQSPRGVRMAVVVSAALWAAVHVPSKPLSQVVRIFIAGLLFGGLYGFSGTNIVGFVVHAAVNAGGAAAVGTFCLCLVAGVLLGRPRTVETGGHQGIMPLM